MKTQAIKLSVIVPVYNTESTLERCLTSLMEQTIINDMEIIVVDDCSPGNVSKIVDKYPDHVVSLVRHKKNMGLFRARITGAKKAKGKYIAFVDSDDYVSVDFYRKMMETAENEHADIIANSTVRKNVDGSCFQYTMHKLAFPKKLIGEDIQREYFAQAGACYAWHTIWNKIYRKELWDKCLPAYEQIKQHLIMTEDIAFSSILFMNAKSFYSINNGQYYYCLNDNASTNCQSITFSKFKKNTTDISTVFDFIEHYAEANRAKSYILDGIHAFRKSYALSWNKLRENLFSHDVHSNESKALINKIAPIQDQPRKPIESYYFEKSISNFYDGLEEIRKKIQDENTHIVSFDIFDTLLLRPLWNADDIFLLMQPKFEQICPEHKNNLFKNLRKAAEEKCRRYFYVNNGKEDITLTHIYEEIREILRLSGEQTEQLKELELNTEYNFIYCRETGKKLLEFALACKKKVIYVSDMYLEEDHVKKLLQKCGYPKLPLYLSSKIGLLKSSTSLFKYVVKDLDVSPKNILHVGDTWETDCICSQKAGLRFAFLPKTKDIFSNSFSQNKTNNLSLISSLAGKDLTTYNMMMKSIAYRSMLSLVANHFFDDPFSSWNSRSDFDANPSIIGYFPLGMHLVSICTWLAKLADEKQAKHITFLARDGYLPIKAFRLMKNYTKSEHLTLNYVPCSRLALLPVTINDKNGLYNLPISYAAHSPLSLFRILRCCHYVADDTATNIIRKAGFCAEKNFTTIESYLNFIDWFANNIFSQEKLNQAKENISSFYRKQIPENAIVFDLGYSGSIACSLEKSLGYPVHHAFVHEDYSSTDINRRRSNISINVMYDFVPQNRDLIRELCLSETNNQCTGFSSTTPIYRKREIGYAENFVTSRIFDSALMFVENFSKTFDGFIDYKEIKHLITSAPFEGFLSTNNSEDKEVFSSVFTEDAVYGNSDEISISDFWKNLSDTATYAIHERSNSNQQLAFLNINNLSKVIDVYRNPKIALKYLFMSKFAFKKDKRHHYKKLLGLVS